MRHLHAAFWLSGPWDTWAWPSESHRTQALLRVYDPAMYEGEDVLDPLNDLSHGGFLRGRAPR